MAKLDASTPPSELAQQLWAVFQARVRAAQEPFLLGISGLQGSGKSTLAQALVEHARRLGMPAQTLSLDDVYLTRRERRQLAARVHPLLITRGVPGTHDIELLTQTLDALAFASPTRPVALPRFDKGRDSRRPASRWPRVTEPPQLIVLEGWCVGVSPQTDAALAQPNNDLEYQEDPDTRWRRHVNTALGTLQGVWKRLDALVLLTAPDWPTTCRWRAQAEKVRRARNAPQAMSAAELRRFMQHFERLSRHALRTLPQRADLEVQLDATRHARLVDVSRRRN